MNFTVARFFFVCIYFFTVMCSVCALHAHIDDFIVTNFLLLKVKVKKVIRRNCARPSVKVNVCFGNIAK